MRESIDRRLKELKAEYETGQRMLAELVEKETQLRNTMMRIAGAMQVLEELLKGEAGTEGTPPAQ